MNQAHVARSISVTLHIDPDGQVSLGQQVLAAESASFQEATKTAPRPAAFDVPFDASYADCKGYDKGFLGQGKLRVNFPKLSADLESKVSRLLKPVDGNEYLLQYHNFSVVMHAQRRFAIYSAANVRHSQRFLMSRPGDVWRVDPRIPIEHQVRNFTIKIISLTVVILPAEWTLNLEAAWKRRCNQPPILVTGSIACLNMQSSTRVGGLCSGVWPEKHIWMCKSLPGRFLKKMTLSTNLSQKFSIQCVSGR